MTNEIKKLNIEQELAAIRSGVRQGWNKNGSLLLEIKESRYWQKEGATSFTNWIEKHPADFGVKDSMMWDYVRVSRYYINDMQHLLKKWQLPAPPLVELPEHVTLELMLLLSKMACKVPESEYRTRAEELMAGTARRETFRNVVKAYQQSNGSEGKWVSSLLTDKTLLTDGNIKKFVLYQNLVHFNGIEHVPDIVIAVELDNGTLEVHGVEIKTEIKRELPHQLEALAEYVDKLWVGLPVNAFKAGNDISISRFAGLLTINDSGVIVRNFISRNEKSGSKVSETLRALLKKSL